MRFLKNSPLSLPRNTIDKEQVFRRVRVQFARTDKKWVFFIKRNEEGLQFIQANKETNTHTNIKQ